MTNHLTANNIFRDLQGANLDIQRKTFIIIFIICFKPKKNESSFLKLGVQQNIILSC